MNRIVVNRNESARAIERERGIHRHVELVLFFFSIILGFSYSILMLFAFRQWLQAEFYVCVCVFFLVLHRFDHFSRVRAHGINSQIEIIYL